MRKQNRERKWALQLLEEGMRETSDFRLFDKRHGVGMLLSFHDTQSLCDHSCRVSLSLLLFLSN